MTISVHMYISDSSIKPIRVVSLQKLLAEQEGEITLTLITKEGQTAENALKAPYYKEAIEHVLLQHYRQQPDGLANYQKTDNPRKEGKIGYLYLSEDDTDETGIMLMLHGNRDYRKAWHTDSKPVAMIDLHKKTYMLMEGHWDFQGSVETAGHSMRGKAQPGTLSNDSVPARGMNETLKRDTIEVMKALGWKPEK